MAYEGFQWLAVSLLTALALATIGMWWVSHD